MKSKCHGPGIEKDSTSRIIIDGGCITPFLEIPNLNVNCRDPLGRTLLLAACSSHQGPDEDTPLNEEELESREPESIANVLLRMGADPLARDNDGRNAMHHMLLKFSCLVFRPFDPSLSYRETGKLFVSKWPMLLHERDSSGCTPIHYAIGAVRNGDTELLDLFLAAGADPAATDNEGNSPVHAMARVAAVTCHMYPSWKNYQELRQLAGRVRDLFQGLLKRPEVDINARNKSGLTPLFCFANQGVYDEQPAPRTVRPDLHTVREMIDVFVQEGADLFTRDKAGNTLLHIAALRDKRERFQVFLDLGLDPLAENAEMRTALDIASVNGSKNILSLFEKKQSQVVETEI